MDIAGMVDNVLKSQAFKLKGRLYTFTVLQLLNTDTTLFAEQLDDVITRAPKLFGNTPVVLDCTALADGDVDLDVLFHCMRSHGMLPVALQGANPVITLLAQTKGIAVLHASATHDKLLVPDRVETNPVETDPVETVPVVTLSRMLTTPVRSGQQVVSKGGDLIITAAVSHGAELLADGNIHVYGVLRGRALAGISGDRNARIFCQSLDAELISIAGFYRLSDAIEPYNGACQIYLEGEHICIEPLN